MQQRNARPFSKGYGRASLHNRRRLKRDNCIEVRRKCLLRPFPVSREAVIVQNTVNRIMLARHERHTNDFDAITLLKLVFPVFVARVNITLRVIRHTRQHGNPMAPLDKSLTNIRDIERLRPVVLAHHQNAHYAARPPLGDSHNPTSSSWEKSEYACPSSSLTSA